MITILTKIEEPSSCAGIKISSRINRNDNLQQSKQPNKKAHPYKLNHHGKLCLCPPVLDRVVVGMHGMTSPAKAKLHGKSPTKVGIQSVKSSTW